MAGRTSNRLGSTTREAGAFARGPAPRGGRGRAASLRVPGLVVAIAAVLGLAGSAGAQGPYVGGSVGATDIDIGIWGNSDHTTTFKVFAGYELPEIVGFEAAWVNLGGHKRQWLESAVGTRQTDGWTAAVTGRIPIVSWFAVYGKLGYFFWNTRFDADQWWGNPTTGGSNSGREPFLGVGVRFDSGRLSFLGEYERYKTGDLGDHKVFAFAVRYTF